MGDFGFFPRATSEGFLLCTSSAGAKLSFLARLPVRCGCAAVVWKSLFFRRKTMFSDLGSFPAGPPVGPGVWRARGTWWVGARGRQGALGRGAEGPGRRLGGGACPTAQGARGCSVWFGAQERARPPGGWVWRNQGGWGGVGALSGSCVQVSRFLDVQGTLPDHKKP